MADTAYTYIFMKEKSWSDFLICMTSDIYQSIVHQLDQQITIEYWIFYL